MYELFKSDRPPPQENIGTILKLFVLTGFWEKKFLLILMHEFLFYFLNIEAYLSFIPSLKNTSNVVLGSINWFSFETVAFVMRMCLKMMLVFPKIMWLLQRDSCKGDFPKNFDISVSNNIQYSIIFNRQYGHLDIKKYSTLLHI